jgi:hypothetical protein
MEADIKPPAAVSATPTVSFRSFRRADTSAKRDARDGGGNSVVEDEDALVLTIASYIPVRMLGSLDVVADW